MTELNPKNEALTQLREHWQKVLMMVMHKHGITEVTLDAPDMQWMLALAAQGKTPFLVTEGRGHLGPNYGFTLRLFDDQQEALAFVASRQGRG